MKRILVPTDFSIHADYALKVAAQIARENDCELFLLNLLDLPTHMNDAVSSGVNIPEVMLFLKKTNDRFEEIKDSDAMQGIKITSEARSEKAFEGIAKYSKEHQIDLIVMGSHGASGHKDTYLGSNTEKAVRHSEVPVLIIKEDTGNFNPQNFVFATDFSEETKKPFQKLLRFMNLFNSKLNLVMVNTPNNFKPTHVAEKIMKDFMKDIPTENYTLNFYCDTNVEKGITNYANSVNADLIGVFTHGRTGITHFFNGSTSEDLAAHLHKPVITFKI